MIIEFESIRYSLKEDYEKEASKAIVGDSGVSFENEHDYIAKIAIDIKKIVGFSGGHVWYNGDQLDCVYAHEKDNIQSVNLLIKYEDFKKLFVKVNEKVTPWYEVINNK